MAGFLDQKRSEISDRIAELRPRVAEYKQLQAAAQALDGVRAPSAAPAAQPRAGHGRRGPGRPRGSRTSTTATAARTTAKAPGRRTAKLTRGRRKGTGKRQRKRSRS